MQQPLIFTERRLLPKFIDTLLTLIAWGGFFWLIYYGVLKALLERPELGARPFVLTLNTLTIYIIVAVVFGGALIIWAKYNQFRFRVERRSRKPGLIASELAASFQITAALVAELNKARVLTAYHNEFGDISGVVVHLGYRDDGLTSLLRVAGSDF
ncbi:poly-beta-1,6-N-acetyl-D-glucosamine biosynthesis protein PgaD [Salmonella enterica]